MLSLSNIQKKVRYYFYETFYDMWLSVGSRLYFIDILLDTQEYVKYELIMNKRKIRNRNDFKRINEYQDYVMSDKFLRDE